MIIFPAIDIKDRKVVRLSQGKFDQVTEYANDPMTIAKQWESQGANWLHVIDLDGAKEGQSVNSDIIIEIAQTLKIPVQTGGGIRSFETLSKLIDGGLARVILGTIILEDKDFLKQAIEKWDNKIAVSLDCNDGVVAQRGWVESSGIKATDLAKEFESLGLTCLIYTDIARDGMLTGPNLEELGNILNTTNIPIIASGGIANIEDIKNLIALNNDQLLGVITGKAIYENKLDLKEALALC